MFSFWTFGPQGSRQDTSICFEKTRFYFRSFEHVRKDTQTDLHIPADLSHTARSLIDFIFWLDNIKSEKARRLIQQIIYWLSIIFDFGAWWDFIDGHFEHTHCEGAPESTYFEHAPAIQGACVENGRCRPGVYIWCSCLVDVQETQDELCHQVFQVWQRLGRSKDGPLLRRVPKRHAGFHGQSLFSLVGRHEAIWQRLFVWYSVCVWQGVLGTTHRTHLIMQKPAFS